MTWNNISVNSGNVATSSEWNSIHGNILSVGADESGSPNIAEGAIEDNTVKAGSLKTAIGSIAGTINHFGALNPSDIDAVQLPSHCFFPMFSGFRGALGLESRCMLGLATHSSHTGVTSADIVIWGISAVKEDDVDLAYSVTSYSLVYRYMVD